MHEGRRHCPASSHPDRPASQSNSDLIRLDQKRLELLLILNQTTGVELSA
jgi:hypothetical protein